LKVVDVVPFFDEIDLLEIRLNVLHSAVDYFVISEYDYSFAGLEKPYNLQKRLHKFSEFSNKIIYIREKQSKILSPFENDDLQKNSIKRHLKKHFSEKDLLLFGDVDEIPTLEGVKYVVAQLKENNSYFHFAQRMFYGFLNNEHVNNLLISYSGEFDGVKKRMWLGTIATRMSVLNDLEMSQLRAPERKYSSNRISQGGWHYSYCGGEGLGFIERATKKIRNNAHQEMNRKEIIDELDKNIRQGRDILKRKNRVKLSIRKEEPRFSCKPLEQCTPEFVIKNQDKFKHLIFNQKSEV
jgi:beta-1,4-mannosyl-glycoprotein beta-1,4-N-acetylglucosaminyltransferase